ncbi:acetoin utilization protein acuB [Nonlabens spongiae]|uniref:Acetoin utilization protein acuB n=1 Tax=Nonlabens spongiae TaxID=331648 RepID=A0A1W6MKQ3_9FLAO|nr:CBS domain-containing protein [Nonlabens spongiae]ARN78165.1 acetoin utilization protein acuB [Nonlabens spongiae]
MQIHDYIINDVQPLDINDSVKKAQTIFSQMTYSHIPIMDQGFYIGCISETDAHCFDSKQTMEEIKYSMSAFQVDKNTHWLEILKAFAQNQSNIMPVLDENKKYLGYYELTDVMEFFNEAPFLNEPGNVVVVTKGSTDFSFSEIAQIVETNDAELYGLFISDHKEHLTEITLKISTSNLSAILQTFRRYSYEVLSLDEDDSYLDTLKERSDYLDKYLNI